jgi:hypothetical protein
MAITLLDDELDGIPMLPRKTIGLADGNLKSALASQAFREGEAFSNKLVNALVGSAMTNIKDTDNPTEDDMSALGLAMSLTWAHGEIPYFLALGGLLAQVFEKCRNDENRSFIIPSEVIAIVGTGSKASSFGRFEPYDLLEDKVSVENLIEGAPEDIADRLRAVVKYIEERD